MRLDERITVATPEGITLEIVLAGLGSRFLARLLDSLIQVVIIAGLALGIFRYGMPGVVQAAGWVVLFLVMFAYDVPFEVLNNGRTPGKMAAGIRVVEREGEPIGFIASAIRNIVRIVDFLPIFYVVGSISIVATTDDQRLGDLAAGTYVVRDRFPGLALQFAPPITVPSNVVASWDVSAINADELATIRQFLDRRLALTMPVRSYFGNALAQRFGPRVAGAPYGMHPEYLLEGIVVAKQGR